MAGLCPAMLLFGLAAASVAEAADCVQEKAVYADRDGAYTFAFEPVGSEAAATSHHFKVTMPGRDLALTGIVMTSDDGVTRANGMIMHNCPEGDATGEEIAACTVWEGVIYSVEGNSLIGILPSAGEKAAPELLFAGLGPAFLYSALNESGRLPAPPWDLLSFRGCAP
ncbi:hypothetical protein LXM94_08415 [Rhizobium sp. TRM95111]|uniref:hypothetical protein n=1 Tax=Rhizobium alarense TaxID=2846851 RepID=UPI001F47E149|nr:hypothetical protein [Rhizobium alarense]MCF3639991.1 hypothetical protein [Rhizobium alarense]